MESAGATQVIQVLRSLIANIWSEAQLLNLADKPDWYFPQMTISLKKTMFSNKKNPRNIKEKYLFWFCWQTREARIVAGSIIINWIYVYMSLLSLLLLCMSFKKLTNTQFYSPFIRFHLKKDHQSFGVFPGVLFFLLGEKK